MKHLKEYLDFTPPPGQFKTQGGYYYLIDNTIEYDELYPYEHPHYHGMLKLPIYNTSFMLDDLDNRALHDWAIGEGEKNHVVGTAKVYIDKQNNPIIDSIETDHDITKEDITYLSVDTDELYEPAPPYDPYADDVD